MNEHSINVGVSLDTREFRTGMEQVQSTIRDASGKLGIAAETAATSSKFAFKSIQQALNTTIRDYEKLVMTEGLHANSTKEAAAKIYAYKEALMTAHTELNRMEATLSGGSAALQNTNKSFNLLGYSVAQMTRELPAFAHSAQVGFLALSNNIPIFFDAVQRMKQANLELKETGQIVPSVGMQVAKALFSWQSALSIGVTLLTIFGSKLLDIGNNTKSATEDLKNLRLEQEKLNEAAESYIRTDLQNALYKENQEYEKTKQTLQDLVKTKSIPTFYTGVDAQEAAKLEKERMAVLVQARYELELVETRHQEKIKAIQDRFAEINKNSIKKQAETLKETYETAFEETILGHVSFNTEMAALHEELNELFRMEPAYFDPSAAKKMSKLYERFTEDAEENAKNIKQIWATLALNIGGDFAENLGRALVGAESSFDNVYSMFAGIAAAAANAMFMIGTALAINPTTAPMAYSYFAAGAALKFVAGALGGMGSKASSAGAGAGAAGGGGRSTYGMGGGGINYDTMSTVVLLDGRVRGSDIIISSRNQDNKNKRVK